MVRAAGTAVYSIINTDTGIAMFRIYSDGITYTMKSVATLSEETDYAKFEVKDGEKVISISDAGTWEQRFTLKQEKIRINRYGICYDTGSGKWQEDSAVTIRGGDYADIMPVVFLLAGTILK